MTGLLIAVNLWIRENVVDWCVETDDNGGLLRSDSELAVEGLWLGAIDNNLSIQSLCLFFF